MVFMKDQQQAQEDAPKYRALYLFHRKYDGGTTVWIGPATLSPREVDAFKGYFERNLPLPEKYKDPIPVDISKLVKIIDS